ncbi:MAG: bifunctional phosphoribosylaminoimidazolecarboxamide formyltransferase/inosine monophosphate cyclohydrolase [Euryarchaeota archaeon]|nr:bifunctional phosphoribosylaminoimidazolecarboxamide formyltransferase/inosine monophosphate cyclohydrolase [Euryarchaeota archaeon]
MARPRALISVWDKTGVEDLATALNSMDWEIISTGGTASKLRKAGLKVTDVSDVSGHTEILDGRVKTLHPALHAGILARRDSDEDMQTLDDLGYAGIDMVCVNLYPFEDTAAVDPPASDQELIEMIDIGGPTMVRSAAKNYADVIIVTQPEQYASILHALSESNGKPSGAGLEMRKELALSAFQSTAAYDSAISNELWSRFIRTKIPNRILASSKHGIELRYGENPHQYASFYPSPGKPRGLSRAEQHGGKPLSYNNYLDLDAALRLVRSLSQTCDFESHSCAVIKHTNPCGASVSNNQVSAWENALASDPESAFGCVIAFDRVVEKETAESIANHFFECMIAPGYQSDALEVLSNGKNRRMLTLDPLGKLIDEPKMRQVQGGWLSQIQGIPRIDWENVRHVTENTLDEEDLNLARFGTSVIAEVQSNAIILVHKTESGYSTVGVGPGQTSRVEAVRIAARRAGTRAKGAMMISDAFFPFRDGVDTSNEIGITSIVQPGGSIRDDEVIEAANEFGIAMVFTGTRLFRH